LQPDSPFGFELVKWLMENGPDDRIRAVLKDLRLSVNDYIRLGTMALGQGRDNLALAIYTQGTKKHKDSSLLWNNLAWVASRLPDFDQQAALDAAAKAFALDKTNPAIVDTYSLILLQQGKYQQCIQVIGEKIPESSRTVVLLDRLARAYEAIDDVEAALTTYDQMLALDDRILLGNNFFRQDILDRKTRLAKAGGGSSDTE
jgi:tetratricopeptide (TPR) repeat protein